MNCSFCQKLFEIKSNLLRHQKTCKSNPDKPIKEAKIKISKSQILLEKEELINKEKLLLQELELMKKLLMNKEENKVIEKKVEKKDNPFKKDKYLEYIQNNYSNALDIKDALLEINNLLTLEQFKLIVFKPYVSKYKSVLELLFNAIPLEKRPFVILKNIPEKEIGYVNINGKFYKYYGEQLYSQLNMFVTGTGLKDWVDKCKGIQNILVCRNSELKETNENFYSQVDEGFLTSIISILGTSFDETDSQLKKARQEICKYIIDSCMIIQE
jgi:hypothetical protein